MERSRSEVRHAIRGTLNALKLCVSALDMPLPVSEKVDFLSDVEYAAGRLTDLMTEFEALPESAGPLPDEAPVTTDYAGRAAGTSGKVGVRRP